MENYVNEAKDLLQKAQDFEQIIFCDELPPEGKNQCLYLVSNNNGLYYWKNTSWEALNDSLKISGGTLTGDLILMDGSSAASKDYITEQIKDLKLPETYEAKGSADALLGDASEAYNTLGKLEDAVIAAQTTANEKTTMAAVEAKDYATKTEAQDYAIAVVGKESDTSTADTIKGTKAYVKNLNEATEEKVAALQEAINEGGSIDSRTDAKINELNVAEVAIGTGEIIEKISETGGKISVSKRALVANDIPTITQSQVDGLETTLASK